MVNDLQFIKLFLIKENYLAYHQYLNHELLAKETQEIFFSLKQFFKEHKDEDNLDIDKLETWFLHFYKKALLPEEKILYTKLFSKMKDLEDIDEALLIKELEKKALYEKISDKINNNNPIEDVYQLILAAEEKINSDEVEVASTDISKLFKDHDVFQGLRWRLDCLNKNVQPINNGLFAVITARVNAGKTSFLASEISYIAQQLKDDEIIIWVSTEGSKEETKMRLLSCIFGMSLEKISLLHQKGYSKTLTEKYLAKLNGRERVLVIDGHGMTIFQIEKFCKKYNTKLLVLDMIDDIPITGLGLNKNSTSVKEYELKYHWARQLSVKLAPVLATSQLKAKDDKWTPWRQKYPYMEDLYGSNVGKQGKAKYIITLGFEQGKDKVPLRYIATPKSKSPLLSSERENFRSCIKFDFDTGIFSET